MALYKVDSDTADLTKVAGGTLYADLPIGSWIKNDMATIPSGFLKVGDTIPESECPELYAKYGSTVPYKADTSELSEYETFTITTSNKEVNYDGILIINFNPSSSTQTMNGQVFVNNVSMGYVSSSNGQQQAIMVEVKKGDNVKYAGSNTGTVTGKIAYYKKSLIIKAKHTPVPADFMSKVDEAVEDACTDTVTSGSTAPITSGGVYASKIFYKTVSTPSGTVSAGGVLGNNVSHGIDESKFTVIGGSFMVTANSDAAKVWGNVHSWSSGGKVYYTYHSDIGQTVSGIITLYYVAK